MRESWTDARLDDFAKHVDSRFDAVDKRFESLERRMDDGFTEIDARFDTMNSRFDSLQRTLLQLGGGVIVALIGLIATQL